MALARSDVDIQPRHQFAFLRECSCCASPVLFPSFAEVVVRMVIVEGISNHNRSGIKLLWRI